MGWTKKGVLLLTSAALCLSALLASGPAEAKTRPTPVARLNSGLLGSLSKRLEPWQPHNWNKNLVGIRTEYVYESVKSYQGTLYVMRPKHLIQNPAPVVVYVHGGSLLHGTAVIGPDSHAERDYVLSRVERRLVSEGFEFVSVNYRLAPQYPWPAQIEDVKTAIRFLRAHAASLHIDSTRIGIMGDSAGGALSSIAGLAGPSAGFDVGKWSRYSSNVSAVCDMFGPSDRRFTAAQWRMKHGSAPNPVFGVLRTNVIRKASAIDYVHHGAPPFLIIQGTQDTVVPPRLSRELYDRLSGHQDHVHVIWVRNSQHEFRSTGLPISPHPPTIVEDVAKFFEKQIGAPRLSSQMLLT